MSFINYSSREINCKIVYYGPGLGGKTTNLNFIYGRVRPDAKGKMISLATETERTLFFDFLPLSLGDIKGFKTRFHLYTVPGQIFYDASRKLILKGVDGIVFVSDSQMERLDANPSDSPGASSWITPSRGVLENPKGSSVNVNVSSATSPLLVTVKVQVICPSWSVVSSTLHVFTNEIEEQILSISVIVPVFGFGVGIGELC